MKSWPSLVVLTFWLAGCDRLPSSSSAPPAPEPQTATVAAVSRPPAPAESNTERCQRARALESDGKLAEAHALLQPLADDGAAPDNVLALLSEIDTKVLFSAMPAQEKIDYTIVSGDSLGRL